SRLRFFDEKPTDGEWLKAFITQVHALKSASASIGAAEVSDLAKTLENAGNAGDLDIIEGRLARFRFLLSNLIEKIRAALAREKTQGKMKIDGGDSEKDAAECLRKLQSLLEAEDIDAVDELLGRLSAGPLGACEALMKIQECVLTSEYAAAAEIAGLALREREANGNG
ncbi:MAG: Hpt domain-containing protein, partial [Synergistaceae bacterium]|nr:Hpt domain-containing protein [Synergistaceae bacterium]